MNYIYYDCYCREKKRKHKHKHKSSEKSKKRAVVDEDAIKHGGWWKATKFEDIAGSVAIQFGNRTFVKSLDNGLFTLGAPHDEGDGPSPEEIFTALPINESHIAFKSGYGKYMKVEKDGVITGRSDAVSAVEQFEAVFQDGKMALQAANGCFLAIDPEDDAVVALRKKVGEAEYAVIRSSTVRNTDPVDDGPTEEKGSLAEVEINYV